MNTKYKQVTLEHYRDYLDLSIEWLNKYVKIKGGSRFTLYQKRISEIIEARDSGTIREKLGGEDSISGTFVLQEIMELISIYKGLSKIDVQPFLDSLKEYVTGPTYPIQEITSASNRARNFGFELYIASLLLRCGLTDVTQEKGDIKLVFENKTYIFECKRPQKRHKINSNLKDAINQIKTKVQMGGQERGLFGISLNKSLNPNQALLVVNSESEIASNFSNQVDKFISEYKSKWRSFPDYRLLGGIVSICLPVLIKPTPALVPCEYASYIITPNKNTEEFGISKKLGTFINDKFQII